MITSHFVTGMFTIGSYIVDLPSQVLSTSTEVSDKAQEANRNSNRVNVSYVPLYVVYA